MPGYNKRTQVLLSEEQHKCLRSWSEQTGDSVGKLIRDAIDTSYVDHPTPRQRAQAVKELLAMEPIPFEGDSQDVKREIGSMWEKHLDAAPSPER